MPSPTPTLAASLRERLLAHYDARGRDLPWRREADPYRVWVSEVMLQQTRVEAVIPYYERWLARFPTLPALAEAELDDVLRQWEGLGYYARARNLHRAARVVRERHGGTVPASLEELRRLPGVGDYTAGAIASIAFDIPAPAVDGNVRRVFSRLFDLPDPTPATLRELGAGLVPEERPGDFNQALMELGATVCTPRAPACGECPLATLCLAHERGTVATRPRPKPRKALPEEDVASAVVVSRTGRLLLVRRPEDGLLGGLWEFPGTAPAADEALEAAAARAAGDLLELELEPRGALGSIGHVFSHRRVTYHAFRFEIGRGPAPGPEESPEIAWVAPADLEGYALPVAQRKIAALAIME